MHLNCLALAFPSRLEHSIKCVLRSQRIVFTDNHACEYAFIGHNRRYFDFIIS
ncbi:hypothetical protein WN48_05356 [Eufriesea mexicana]|nr:hypothetical protein WN48_05356 [Eufriesea mexicana]